MKNRKIQPAAVSGDAGAAVITAPSNWQETDAWLDGIDFKDDDFEFQHKDGFRHVDHVFAGRSYWADAFARFKANRGAVFGFICICVLVFFAIVGPYMNALDIRFLSRESNIVPYQLLSGLYCRSQN